MYLSTPNLGQSFHNEKHVATAVGITEFERHCMQRVIGLNEVYILTYDINISNKEYSGVSTIWEIR